MSQDYVKNFEIRRAMICHEDTLIGQRLSSSMTVQSFMVAAVTLLFVNAYRNPRLVGFLILSVTVAALLLSTGFYLAINAARHQQARIRGDMPSEDYRADFEKVFPLEEEGTVKDRTSRRLSLQSHGTTFFWGFSYLHIVQWTLFLTWISLLAISLLLIFDTDFRVFGISVLFNASEAPNRCQ